MDPVYHGRLERRELFYFGQGEMEESFLEEDICVGAVRWVERRYEGRLRDQWTRVGTDREAPVTSDLRSVSERSDEPLW